MELAKGKLEVQFHEVSQSMGMEIIEALRSGSNGQ